MKLMRSPIALLVDLVGWGLEGPVDEEGPADDVFAGDEAPVAAVEADRCGCRPWRSTLPGGTTRSSPCDVAGEIDGPAGGDVAALRRAGWRESRRDRGK